MNFSIAYCEHDRDQMARWLSWVEELGGMGRHRLFIMPAKGERADFRTSIPFEVVPDYYGTKSEWSANNDLVRDAAGPNSMLRQFATYFSMKKLGAWTFIEPDCIPLRVGWHDEWEADYQRGGQPFMGGIVEVPGVPKHSTGNMVLPENAADLYVHLMIPQIADIGGRKVELAFDIAAASEILPRHHETKLIQHVFRGPKFEKPEDLARIDPQACLWHSDKDGGLIRLLRGVPTYKDIYEHPGEVVFTRENAMRGLVPSPGATIAPDAFDIARLLVHTYFRPCDDPDALAEQKRILAIWERSWREAGFEPVILTEAHARKHPRFEEYRAAFDAKPTINPKAYEMACWLRWVAMATIGGLLVDYDCLPFGRVEYRRSNKEFPMLLCEGVPCAVVGTAAQYETAINAFIVCRPISEQGIPHLSDMHAIQVLACFPSGDVCREYGKPGWKEAELVHFNHYSCNPRKRSECMEGAAAERSEKVTVPMVDTVKSIVVEISKDTVITFNGGQIISVPCNRICLGRELTQLLCTPTNGPTAVSSGSPTAPANRRRARAAKKSKRLKPPTKRSPEQVEKDRARMARVRAAKLAKT